MNNRYHRSHSNVLVDVTGKLFLSPWWISMSTAFFFLYLFRAIIPFTIKDQIIFSGIISLSKILGTWSFLFFFVISIISAMRELTNFDNKTLKPKTKDVTKNTDRPIEKSAQPITAETKKPSNVNHTLSPEKEQNDIEITICDDTSCELPYVKKNNLITKTERDFLRVLIKAVDGRANIYPQVRLWDILKVSTSDNKNKLTHENKIRSKHIDFTLCDKKTLKILGCIELDDKSHNNEQAIKNDRLKDEAFKAAGLPLIRIRCESYTLNSVKNSIDKLWQ